MKRRSNFLKQLVKYHYKKFGYVDSRIYEKAIKTEPVISEYSSFDFEDFKGEIKTVRRMRKL